MGKIIKESESEFLECRPFQRSLLEPVLSAALETDEGGTEEHEPFDEEARRQEVEEELDRYREQVHRETEEKVKKAYAEGLRRGEEAGRAAFEEKVQGVLEAIQQMEGEIRRAREGFLKQIEDDIFLLIRVITRKILLREGQLDESAIRRVLQAALENLVEREWITIRMNPRDMEIARREAADFDQMLENISGKDLVADEAIAPGGCIVESQTMRIDARLDHQLEVLLESLEKINFHSDQDTAESQDPEDTAGFQDAEDTEGAQEPEEVAATQEVEKTEGFQDPEDTEGIPGQET